LEDDPARALKAIKIKPEPFDMWASWTSTSDKTIPSLHFILCVYPPNQRSNSISSANQRTWRFSAKKVCGFVLDAIELCPSGLAVPRKIGLVATNLSLNAFVDLHMAHMD
jgi:hypothetical protein